MDCSALTEVSGNLLSCTPVRDRYVSYVANSSLIGMIDVTLIGLESPDQIC